MNKHLQTVLVKGALEMNEEYSQKNAPKEVEQSRLKALSQRSIKSQHKIEEIVRQITRQQKIAATFIRNILRSVMRKNMKRMLQRLVFKKTAYKLLTSKKKRDIEPAFLQLKYNKVRREHTELQGLFDRHIPFKILSAFIKKKERENLGVSFENMKNLATRSRKVTLFLEILLGHFHNFIVRFHYFDFFNKLSKIQRVQYQHQTKAEDIIKIDKIRVRNLQQFGFVKIMDTILLGQYHETSNVHKSKNQTLTQMTVNRKQFIAQLKQQLKNIKTSIDQEKANRTKVFQQRKKYNNSNKIAMIDAVKKFQKEFKVQQAITKDIQRVFNDKERVISVKTNLQQKAEGSHQHYLQLITLIRQHQGDKIKKISQFRPQFDDQLENFKQSEIYLFKTNAKFQKLIEIYEKRQPYNYESEYYELEYQNNVIREMIRAFVREKSFVEILLRTKNKQQKEENQQEH